MFNSSKPRWGAADASIDPECQDVSLADEEATVESAAPLLANDEEKTQHHHTTEPVRRFTFLRDSHSRTTSPLAVSVLSSLSTIAIIASLWLILPRLFPSLFHPHSYNLTYAPSIDPSQNPFIYDQAFSRSRPGTTHCGSTVTEALANNCTFDELADLWLPPHCSRHYATQYATSLDGGPQRYWADQAGRHEIFNRSLYVEPTQIYWSTVEDHLVHCAFNMYRFAHSLRHGSVVGHDGSFSGHVEHCAGLMVEWALKAEGIGEINVETQSGFGYC